MLEMLLNGQYEPDSVQTDSLTNIAGQCLYEGGEAVLQARAMLGTANSYDDLVICAPPSPFIRPGQEKHQIGFAIYPNPSNGYLVIELDEELGSDGQAVVTSTLGQSLLTEPLKAGSQQVLLELDGLPAGTYYITVKEGEQSTTKLFTNLK